MKATKEDFKAAMRMAKIEEEVEREMNSITDIEKLEETPKRRPGRPKKEQKEAPVAAAPKKRGRKAEPKKTAVKAPEAAGQDKEQEALKGLVEIADRWVNGRKVDADRYMKISEDISAQVKQYQGYIDTVKEMIK